MGFFSECVSAGLLKDFMRKDQKTAILELEGLAVLTASELFTDFIKGRKLVIFTDNQAVQSCLIKCRSVNEHLDLVSKRIGHVEESLRMMAWTERVPSLSKLGSSEPL